MDRLTVLTVIIFGILQIINSVSIVRILERVRNAENRQKAVDEIAAYSLRKLLETKETPQKAEGGWENV